METFHEILEECILETGMITKIPVIIKTKSDHVLDDIAHTQNDHNPRRNYQSLVLYLNGYLEAEMAIQKLSRHS